MSNNQPQREGFWTLGHKWITAIAALITALATAGIIVGVNGGSSEKSGNALPESAQPVPSAEMSPPAQSSASEAVTASTSSSAPADPTVYWNGPLKWGDYNLDFKPPHPLDSKQIRLLSGRMFYAEDKSRLESWPDGTVPGREDCAGLAGTSSSNQVDHITEGEVVCGVTAEGRSFRITVKQVGSESAITDVVVWNR